MEWSELEGLQKGWDSYQADPPSPEAIAAAKEYWLLLDWRRHKSSFSPMVDGGVAVSDTERGDGITTLEFHNDGDIVVTVTVGEVLSIGPIFHRWYEAERWAEEMVRAAAR